MMLRFNDIYGDAIWINASRVHAVSNREVSDEGCRVWMGPNEGDYFIVRNTPVEVVNMINDALSGM